jgi:DNA mismatch repair protein MutL
MPKIHRLPADLANQIAAGEVVERPASVIKELIENAIDAHARRIAVTIEFGGKKLIRVDDDGEGMDAEDARLAIERHATSKLARADDLERIATLGFRGEALPSIASVSHFVLRTRTRDAVQGTEIRVNGGALAAVAEAGVPHGTSIEVGDVFYNLPARRKFLKSDGAEAAQVSRIVTQLALCYPEIGFTLTGSGRKVLQCPPVAGLRDRLFQLYGDRPDLVEVRRASGDVTVTGYIAALAEQGPTRGPQNVFVNRRVVRDRTIAHAIADAYSVASIKERSPEVHLFVEMPHDAVDVNVHPTKAEVRFRDQSHIHQVIRRAVADTLGRGPAPELTLEPTRAPDPQSTTLPLPASYAAVYPSRWTTAPTREPSTGDIATVGPFPAASEATIGASPIPSSSEGHLRPMIALGQFRDTFIVAVDEEGIAIVDQHVAHERVLFERITERLSSGRLESQRLLDPLLVDLPASGRDALRAHAADLERLGFDVEEFGGDTVRVSALPALLRRGECETALRALADDLEGLELRRTAYSTICPHGRPVMLRLSRREIEKNFLRI